MVKAPGKNRIRRADVRNDTRARLTGCRCGCLVVQGYSAERAGWLVKADPVPLRDAAAELLAVLAGRCTWDLAVIGGGFRLIERDHFSMADRSRPVVADHRCGSGVPAAWWHQVKGALITRRDETPAAPPF